MHYCGDFRTTYEKDIEILQTPTVKIGVAVAVVAFLVVLPFLVKGEYLWIGLQILIAVIGAVGLNILTGFTGQISLGQGAFLGVGAYTSAYITTKMGLSFWVGVPAAGLVTAAGGNGLRHPFAAPEGALPRHRDAGVPVHPRMGLPALGAGDGRVATASWSRAPRSAGTSSIPTGPIYYIVLAIAVGDGPVRREPRADPDGARLHGGAGPLHLGGDHGDQPLQVPDPLLRRLLLLRRGRGALLGHSLKFVSSEQFNIGVSIAYLAMIIIGGLGSILGSIYGAIFMILLPKLLTVLTAQLERCYPGDRGPGDRAGAGDLRR